MKASTLSVLTNGSNSIHMWAKTGRHSMNVSVRFDQGVTATICGYPREAILWDYQVDQYDSESPTGREWMEEVGELPLKEQFYISEQDEIEICEAAIRGIQRQAKDKMFKNDATAEFRKECIEMLERKIGLLRNELPVTVLKAKKGDASKMGRHLLKPTKSELQAAIEDQNTGTIYVHTKATWPKAGAK